jgi:lipoprotein-anchoring transpeptidase ErfK/SrfK
VGHSGQHSFGGRFARIFGALARSCVLFALLDFACVERRHEAAPAPTPAAAMPEPVALVPPPKPSGPPVRLFAASLVVKVRSAALRAAQRIGYLRGGAVVQALTADPIGFDKCRKGWYELDTGGFVCSTLALPFTGKRLPERQGLQPDLTAALPYPYGYSLRRNTPVYRRLPTDEEAAQYEGYRMPGRAPIDAGAATPQSAATNAPPAPPGTPAPPPPPSPAPEAAGAAASGEDAEGEPAVPTLASLMGDSSSVLMRRMERGFYVSLDRELEKGSRRYFRTQNNGFIPSQGLREVHGSEFQGVALKEQGIALPIGFVMSKDDIAYKRHPKGFLQSAGKPGYHFMFAIASEEEVRGVKYFVGNDERYYRQKDVRRVASRDKPAEVLDDEKWIDVDLTTQTLVAYVGAEPVYATLVSTGRIKDELDPLKNFETPAGSYRIKSKHLTATMDGDHAIDGPYSIEDVPYVMYFQLAYALHSAFWHNSFGRPHSHGCVNLAPLDAKWLFGFAEPPLPKAWHGVYPRAGQQGTRLYIHGETPQG